MIRADMISTVGRKYLTSNIENDEYSYPKAFSAASLPFVPVRNNNGRAFEKLDIRFVKDNVTVLIETKRNFTKADEAQLSAYVEYEKRLTGNKTVAVLANTTNEDVRVWRGVVSDSDYMPKETTLRTMDEYVDFYISKVNDKEKVMQNTYKLNEKLHRHSIPEKLRSQFVGTCLLALKNGLDYSTPKLTAAQVRARIKEVLEELLNSDLNKAEKLALLNRNVLGDQYVRQLSIEAFRDILKFIEDNILPFINDKSTSGQDLLNLFFVTFNKYVGKSDKNQAFTPDHITDFMAKITGVNKHSVVLDAVFTLPNEIFYPGASASACCMVFKIGIKHTDVSNPDTFFGYCKDDGFKKKKNIGRVEQTDSTTGKSKWTEIENQWIELYRNRKPKDGLSATHKVTGDDEWLCEAYMKTDYTKLTERDFQQTIATPTDGSGYLKACDQL